MSLFNAAAKNDYDLVKQIIDEKQVDINDTNEDGETSLLIASRKGHLPICELLINNGSNVNDVNKHGETPLHLALRHLPVCELLIHNGADINHKNIDEETPLLIASQLGNLLACELFIRNNADINSVDKYRQTSLHWASLKGHLSICELLIINGANVNYEDEYGRIPLHLASENNHFKVCKLLIRSGADINHNDNDNNTPIQPAMENKNYKIIKLLQEEIAYTTAPDIGIKKNLEFFDVDSSSPADENSPRAVYDKLVHSSQITMLGSEFGPLFKIRIEHPDIFELFENYKNLSENPKIDCVFQVLFSLGLREINISKRNSAVINKLGKYKKSDGVEPRDLNEYLEQIFDLKRNSLLSTYYEGINRGYLQNNLQDGLCTIIILNFDTHSHCVVAFKLDRMMWLFDPQKTNKQGKHNIFEFIEIEDYYPDILGFQVINLNPDVTIENKPLIIDKCNLPMFAYGKKKSKKNSNKSKKSKKKILKDKTKSRKNKK